MSQLPESIHGNVVDLVARQIFPGRLTLRDGRIVDVHPTEQRETTRYLLPGFVDAHIHIESSMLLPSQFARTAVLHGTVATVSDPHEIANVCGTAGIDLMLRDAGQSPFKFFFGAPACVPATDFETAGARLDAGAVAQMLDDPRIGYLSEMMNFPGVLADNPQVLNKIAAATSRHKPVDGHAPGLRGEAAKKYFGCGVTTDHECVTLDEAIEKIGVGCRIAIREGSAARNFDALSPLLDQYPDDCMFCSDDKHPDELLSGHINQLAARAIHQGHDLMNVLRASSLNAVRHDGLDVGLLQRGDPADLVVVSDLRDFQAQETYIDGHLVAKHGTCLMAETVPETINHFRAAPITVDDLRVPAQSSRIRIIEARDGQLVTGTTIAPAAIVGDLAVADPGRDLLKLVVLNRYRPNIRPAIAFVTGFGMQRGAIASSVAHDSHNIVAVGTNDQDLGNAINAVVNARGGLSAACDDTIDILPLPVAGLMTTESCQYTADKYSILNRHVKAWGGVLRAPFMTLSFMALLVIPQLKLSDRGLFDVDKFEFIPVFCPEEG